MSAAVPPALPPRRGLALVGYRGTGKSTVGRLVAERLRRPFIDADSALEACYGRSVRSLFEELGEPAFRDREAALLAELTAVPDRVIATGGGVVLRAENRTALKQFGLVVWLTADPQVLASRLSRNTSALHARPALTAAGTIAEIAEVLSTRLPWYREVADVEVATDGRTLAEVVDAVIAALPWERGMP